MPLPPPSAPQREIPRGGEPSCPGPGSLGQQCSVPRRSRLISAFNAELFSHGPDTATLIGRPVETLLDAGSARDVRAHDIRTSLPRASERRVHLALRVPALESLPIQGSHLKALGHCRLAGTLTEGRMHPSTHQIPDRPVLACRRGVFSVEAQTHGLRRPTRLRLGPAARRLLFDSSFFDPSSAEALR
jgi:hypothetical protein